MTTKQITFEDFLSDKHADGYMGLDDDMPDSFDDWVSNLDVQEIIDYTEELLKTIIK